MLLVAAQAIGAAFLSTSARAEIYRCNEGETVVFSDVPCSESAEVHITESRVSVVDAAGNLDEIAATNEAFVQQRRQTLAQRRERAARQTRQAQRQQQRLEAIEQARQSRTIVGHLGHSGIGSSRTTTADPRTRARRQRSERDEQSAERRTLLSRSGGNKRSILR